MKFSEQSDAVKFMIVFAAFMLVAVIITAAWVFLGGGDSQKLETVIYLFLGVAFITVNVWAMQPISLKRIPPPAEWTDEKGPTLH